MGEALDRSELPIQSVYQRGEDCTATVPIDLKILDLPAEIRERVSLIDEAREVVKQWYNEDMEYHLDVLDRGGYSADNLKSYERFNDSWDLSGSPNGEGFLDLSWNDGSENHGIKFCRIPVILMNQHNNDGRFFSTGYKKEGRLIEIMYRNLKDPDYLFMDPEKMRRYGNETDIARIDLERGVAEVQGHAFCSDYHDNMAKTLLLRDFAVFYLNGLLDCV